tara:strand:+ start:1105 stop:1488 length:384 start_codon:yes stop_codon:yes gene_type:complete
VKPHQLIGLPYRLGADPEKHGAGDCLSLCRTVLKHYGIASPEPKREWYKRLRKGDYSVFETELKRWGVDSSPKLGSIALCLSNENCLGMAAFYEEGWIHYQKTLESQVVMWCPINALMVKGCYYQRK